MDLYKYHLWKLATKGYHYMQLQIAGASIFGILLSWYDPVTCLKFAAGLMMWSLPVMVIAFLQSLLAKKNSAVICNSFHLFSDWSHMVNQQAFYWGS